MLQHELNAAYEAGERAITAGLPFEQPKTPLATDELGRLGRFLAWAKEKCVRACPARPSVVAAYVLQEHGLGTPAQQILAILESIVAFHDHHSAPNPAATAVVRHALGEAIHIEPPRSWPKEDKVLFATLPPDIRDVIARREQAREIELRRKQNEVAELRKRLTTEAATNSVNVEKKETKND
jgi:hypothetical protein